MKKPLDLNEEICPCMGITTGDIKSAIEEGKRTLEEIQEATLASSCCGNCTDKISELVEQFIA